MSNSGSSGQNTLEFPVPGHCEGFHLHTELWIFLLLYLRSFLPCFLLHYSLLGFQVFWVPVRSGSQHFYLIPSFIQITHQDGCLIIHSNSHATAIVNRWQSQPTQATVYSLLVRLTSGHRNTCTAGPEVCFITFLSLGRPWSNICLAQVGHQPQTSHDPPKYQWWARELVWLMLQSVDESNPETAAEAHPIVHDNSLQAGSLSPLFS